MELLKTFNPDNQITFTETATQHLVASIRDSEDAIGVSLALKPAGCAGFEFVWKIVNEEEDGFKVSELGPYKFLLCDMSVDMLAGSVVDLVNEGLKGKTLTVKSPKASGECGCGESVTF